MRLLGDPRIVGNLGFVQGERCSPRPERNRASEVDATPTIVGYRVGETRAVRRHSRPDATRNPTLSADEETDQACYARYARKDKAPEQPAPKRA
jgi:hypothetical protein